jgi:hypothetical protein
MRSNNINANVVILKEYVEEMWDWGFQTSLEII